MTAEVCGAAEILRSGGPVAVPFRPCCVAAVLRAAAGTGLAGLADPISGLAGPPCASPAFADPLTTGPASPSTPVVHCLLEADPAAEAQLLLMTEPIAVGDP